MSGFLFAALFFAMQAAGEGLLVFSLLKLNMLPAAYLGALIAVLLVFLLLSFFLLFVKKQNGSATVRAVRFAAAVLLALCMLAAGICTWRLVSRVNDTISAVTTPHEESKDYVGIYVLKDDPAVEIADTLGYRYGYSTLFSPEYSLQVLDSVADICGSEPEQQGYSDVIELVNDLYAQQVHAIVLDEAYIDLIEDQDGCEDFSEKARLLQEFTFESQPDTSPEAITEIPDSGSFIVYLSGSDARSTGQKVSRSDVNILAVVNPTAKQILLVNTPRDYFVPISISKGAKDKLTHCGLYGVKCSQDTLSALYDIPIHHYAKINFAGFEKLIDAIGGVTIHSDTAFTTYHGKFPIRVGENQLNGYQALCYARERFALTGGDNDRGKNQMKVIKAIVGKMSAGTVISNYAEILSSMEGMFTTDMTSEEISDLVKAQLADMSRWEVLSYAVTGDHGNSTTYSTPNYSTYVMYPHEDTVKRASELINRVMAGEILTDADVK